MDVVEKLEILADAAKYDVACTSSGINRSAQKGKLGNTLAAGICHAFSADGRCITLLKVLMTNVCVYDCAYCANRASNEVRRAAFTPRELADLTIAFYRRNYIEGLFLSSGVLKNPDYTTELMIETLSLLRFEYGFRGYIHAKAVPGTSPELIATLGHLADRMSVNMELPSQASLALLAPNKSRQSILAPMRQIRDNIAEDEDTRALMRKNTTYLTRTPPKKKQRAFVPAGQSTQIIVGATPENDFQILNLSASLYRNLALKRVFFSAYLPVNSDARLPCADSIQLNREHRLYQADWLLRFYNFDVSEIIDEENPYLDPNLDPKANWAINHLDFFPVEINTASIDELMRVPGIGARGARLIARARRTSSLGEQELRKLGIAYKRARFFITCSGRYAGKGVDFSRDGLRAHLSCPIKGGNHGRRSSAVAQNQLSLFEVAKPVEPIVEQPCARRNESDAWLQEKAQCKNEQGASAQQTAGAQQDECKQAAGVQQGAGAQAADAYRRPEEQWRLAYAYDGTLEGLLSAIFAAYANHEIPTDIAPRHLLQPRLGQKTRVIPANDEHAKRVERGICRAGGTRVFEAVKEASLSDNPQTGTIIYSFVRYLMGEQKTSKDAGVNPKANPSPSARVSKRGILSRQAHPAVGPFVNLVRAVGNERHRMMQFLRFEHLEGDVWFAQCNPNANVVPLLMDWFAARFNTQPFIIYDEVHKIAGVYDKASWYLVNAKQITLPNRTADEACAKQAWRQFYNTVAIQSRYNPELRRQFMPKRLWKNIAEMQEVVPRPQAQTLTPASALSAHQTPVKSKGGMKLSCAGSPSCQK